MSGARLGTRAARDILRAVSPRTTRPRTLWRACAVLLATALLFACASSGSRDGFAARVALIDFRDGQRWELRSETHTPQVELYSEQRKSANVKVTTDDVMAELVRYMRELGFDEHAQSGGAPADPGNGYTRAFEVEVDGKARHMLSGPSASREAQVAARELTTSFIALFNEVQGFQHVDSRPGSDVFQSPAVKVQGR